MEMIDDEAAEYGIRFVKINDKLMAKKYGFRDPPGLAYFRKGKHIKFDGELRFDTVHAAAAFSLRLRNWEMWFL